MCSPKNRSRDLARCAEISIPISAMHLMASGWIVFGWVPALATSRIPRLRWRRRPSAIWERQELAVQRNKTLIGSISFPGVSHYRMNNFATHLIIFPHHWLPQEPKCFLQKKRVKLGECRTTTPVLHPLPPGQKLNHSDSLICLAGTHSQKPRFVRRKGRFRVGTGHGITKP